MHDLQTAGLTVLLAEDNPVNQAVTRTLLEQLGHRVVTAGDGVQTLQTLAQQRVDLLLLDVMMPGVDGLAVLKAVRHTEKHTGAHLPVLMLSGEAMDGDREGFLAKGADGHVAKPVNREKLEQALKPWGLTVPSAVKQA